MGSGSLGSMKLGSDKLTRNRTFRNKFHRSQFTFNVCSMLDSVRKWKLYGCTRIKTILRHSATLHHGVTSVAERRIYNYTRVLIECRLVIFDYLCLRNLRSLCYAFQGGVLLQILASWQDTKRKVTHLPLFSQVQALFFSVSGSKRVLFEIQSDGKKMEIGYKPRYNNTIVVRTGFREETPPVRLAETSDGLANHRIGKLVVRIIELISNPCCSKVNDAETCNLRSENNSVYRRVRKLKSNY